MGASMANQYQQSPPGGMCSAPFVASSCHGSCRALGRSLAAASALCSRVMFRNREGVPAASRRASGCVGAGGKRAANDDDDGHLNLGGHAMARAEKEASVIERNRQPVVAQASPAQFCPDAAPHAWPHLSDAPEEQGSRGLWRQLSRGQRNHHEAALGGEFRGQRRRWPGGRPRPGENSGRE